MLGGLSHGIHRCGIVAFRQDGIADNFPDNDRLGRIAGRLPTATGAETGSDYCHRKNSEGDHTETFILRKGSHKSESIHRESERISDSEMESEGITAKRNIEVTARSCVVRRMQPISKISTDHHHTDINAQADTCSKSNIPQE